MARSEVSFSTKYDPPHGSITDVVAVSFCIKSWVFLDILAEKSVGRAIASSKLFVCKDWV